MIEKVLLFLLFYFAIGCLLLLLADLNICFAWAEDAGTFERMFMVLVWPYYLYKALA